MSTKAFPNRFTDMAELQNLHIMTIVYLQSLRMKTT
jgi:hypothetical protein